jgi:hypothetical protein
MQKRSLEDEILLQALKVSYIVRKLPEQSLLSHHNSDV